MQWQTSTRQETRQSQDNRKTRQWQDNHKTKDKTVARSSQDKATTRQSQGNAIPRQHNHGIIDRQDNRKTRRALWSKKWRQSNISCLVWFCLVMSCHVLSCHVLSCSPMGRFYCLVSGQFETLSVTLSVSSVFAPPLSLPLPCLCPSLVCAPLVCALPVHCPCVLWSLSFSLYLALMRHNFWSSDNQKPIPNPNHSPNPTQEAYIFLI
jgi:hypothetical protein